MEMTGVLALLLITHMKDAQKLYCKNIVFVILVLLSMSFTQSLPIIRTETSHFRERVFHERRRGGIPSCFIKEMYPYDDLVGVPEHLRPIHKNLYTSGFPYFQNVDYSDAFEVRERPVVRLEDLGAAATILPGLGGRVVELFDKRLNRQLLWSPPSFHFATLGLSGAWTLGGLEFNPFRYGHNVHGTSALETRKVRLASGREGVQLGAFDEKFSCEWRVVLTLVGGRLVNRITIKNHSANSQPCLYWWSTLAMPLNWRDRIMLAPGEFLHHSMFRQGYEAHPWPMVHNTDWSRWLNQHEVVSGYLANTASEFMGYVNEREGWSFYHRASREICKGRKLWSLGCLNAQQVWWETMAEPSWSPYCELQCGIMPVQPTAGDFPAGMEISWTECLAASAGTPEAGPYDREFAAYESAGIELHGISWDEWNDAAFWRIEAEEALFEPEGRVAVSARVCKGQTPALSEIEEVVSRGWVAGEGWIRALKSHHDALSPHGVLGLAAALLENCAIAEALPELVALANADETCPEVKSWAEFFLGLIAERESRTSDALAHFVRCRFDHDSAVALVTALDQALARMNAWGQRETLWKAAPEAAKATDEFRIASAWIAHRKSDWRTTRALLEKPLLGIAEGASTAWLLWKESHFVEFSECCGRRDWQGAMDALATGAKMAPQFGIGRQEDRQNTDFLFYRYHLCKRIGWEAMARFFAQMILRDTDYPGSSEALYSLRTAVAENDPSTEARKVSVENWSRQARQEWSARLPLRQVLCEVVATQKQDAWTRLLQHPLYGYRAEYELLRGSDCAAAKGETTPSGRSRSRLSVP